MITDAIMDALAATIQAAYDAANRPIAVLSDWPDPQYNPQTPWLILHESDEQEIELSNGLYGTPSGAYDTVLATYRQRALTGQVAGTTMQSAQDAMRADKAILPTAFRGAGKTLGGVVLEAGRPVRIMHPLLGPYEDGTYTGAVRFTWRALIPIRPSLHS